IKPNFFESSWGGAFALSIFVILSYFAELIIFPLFLWVTAKAFKARWATGSAMGLVIFASVTAALQLIRLLITFVWMNSQSTGKVLAFTSAIIALVATLAFRGQMVWYSIVLFQDRQIAEDQMYR